MAPQPIEGSSYIVTASTISSTTQKSTMTLFTGIFQRFRSSGLQQQPKPTIVHPDPLSEVESVSLPSSPVPSSSGGSPLSSPNSSVSQLPEDSSFASPSTLRSRSHRQQSTATATSRRTHRKSRTTRRGQLSEENVQDLQDSIAVARYLIPGYPNTSYTNAASPSPSPSSSSRFPEPWRSHHSDDSCPPEHPENPLLTAVLVVIISSITFIWSLAKSCCISSSQYLSRASSNMAHSWRSWRAGYRLQRQPTSSPSSPSRKRNVPLRTRITRWFKSSPANHPPPPPIWPPPSLVQASNRNRTTNPIPTSHSNAVAGPSAAAPIPRGRGVRRPAPMEYAQPPPPPKSMAKPPMKQWQRRRPVTRSQATSNYPASSTAVSAQGPSSSSSASRLAKIDLQVQVARGMMRSAFQKFREMFHYEVPDAEEIYENPLTRDKREGLDRHLNAKGELMLDIDVTQPTIVTHRMYWQGADEEVPRALSLAVESLLSHLTISNCNIALDDVKAILLLCPSLETLEVRQISSSAKPIARLSSMLPQIRSGGPHGLRSLNLTSYAPVDALFEDVRFPHLHSLSLRLFGEGKWTTFEFLQSLGRAFSRFRLRGDISPVAQAYIKKDVAKRNPDFQLDVAMSYESHGNGPDRRGDR